MKIVVWRNGERNRRPRLYAPCSCGCDERGGMRYPRGYYSRSNGRGTGVTAVPETAAEVAALIERTM